MRRKSGAAIARELSQIHYAPRCSSDDGRMVSYYCFQCEKKCCVECIEEHTDYGHNSLIQVFWGMGDCLTIAFEDCKAVISGDFIRYEPYEGMVRLVAIADGCECSREAGLDGDRRQYCSLQCFSNAQEEAEAANNH